MPVPPVESNYSISLTEMEKIIWRQTAKRNAYPTISGFLRDAVIFHSNNPDALRKDSIFYRHIVKNNLKDNKKSDYDSDNYYSG